MSWDCGLRYMFSVSPALQQGNKCILHDKEDISRLEMVQRLAKDGCRFLQNHSRSPEKTSEVRCICRQSWYLFVTTHKCIDTKAQHSSEIWESKVHSPNMLSLRMKASGLCIPSYTHSWSFMLVFCKHCTVCSIPLIKVKSVFLLASLSSISPL